MTVLSVQFVNGNKKERITEIEKIKNKNIFWLKPKYS